jgi:hypothetical protein
VIRQAAALGRHATGRCRAPGTGRRRAPEGLRQHTFCPATINDNAMTAEDPMIGSGGILQNLSYPIPAGSGCPILGATATHNTPERPVRNGDDTATSQTHARH